MATKPPPLLYAWTAYAVLVLAWIISLAGVGALQQDFGSLSGAERSVAATAGYLGPVSGSRFYGYTWWTIWFQFIILLIVPVLLIKGWVHRFRLGIIGLLVPSTYLLIVTADTTHSLYKIGVSSSRAKALFAGTILGNLAQFSLIILFGAVDEDLAAVSN